MARCPVLLAVQLLQVRDDVCSEVVVTGTLVLYLLKLEILPSIGKSSGSKGGGGKRKASTPSIPNADGLFDPLTSLGASPPGQGLPAPTRKGGHGGPGRGGPGPYSAADDRRLYLASPEEILRYRAGVEYILPENLRVENLRRCCEDGRFKTSLCPLPLPTMQDMASPRHKPGEVKRESSLGECAGAVVCPCSFISTYLAHIHTIQCETARVL